MNDSLKSHRIQVEKKVFFLDLKENERGRFLRITEDVNGRRDSIILPVSGLEEFRKALEQIIQFNAKPLEDSPPAKPSQSQASETQPEPT